LDNQRRIGAEQSILDKWPKKVKITNVKDETVVQRIMTRLFST
jgi:hypothetical protein